MITGDIKETAQSIAKEIGIINDSEIAERSFSGMEYEKFDQNKQLQIISQVLKFPSGLVFSRTEPIHKRQLVQLLSKQVNIYFFSKLIILKKNVIYQKRIKLLQ